MCRSSEWAALLGLAALSLASGCTLEDGDPWGLVQMDLEASFSPEGRLNDQGQVRTSKGYLVTVEALEVQIQSASVDLLAEGGATAFDPANPPAGYSLCHNGHCHRDDGALVDYEDIALELTGQAASAGGVTQAIEASVDLSAPGQPQALPLGPCSQGCQLDPGQLGAATLTLARVQVSLRVQDSRLGDNARLPEGGLSYEITLEGDALGQAQTFQHLLEGEVGKGQPYGVRLRGAFTLGPALFDDADWGALDADDTTNLREALRQGLQEAGALSVTVQRFD
jgi:hypothetical protein